jgi:hypothetical protein
MRAEIIFRQWLVLGLAANVWLLIFYGNHATVFGPTWLWLIAIPLLAWLCVKPRKKRPVGTPQAVRRRNSAQQSLRSL